MKRKDIRKKLNLNGYRLIEFVYDSFMRIKFFLFILLYLVIYSDSFSNTNKEKVLNYLESFDSLKTEFVQVNNNGDILSGNLHLSRPGKFRIEYDQVPLLLICDSKRLAVINKDLKSISFHKFSEVPAGALLFKRLSLKGIKILKILEKDNMLSVNLHDTKIKEKGLVEILFEIKPFIMRKWTLYNNDKSKTEVFFNNLYLDEDLPNSLFDIQREDPRKIPYKLY